MALRKGLYNIEVNQAVEFELSYYNVNKFNKLQFSGYIDGNKEDYWFLPTHQGLVDQLKMLPRGSLVRATRLTAGNAKETAKYVVEVLREGPNPSEQQTLV